MKHLRAAVVAMLVSLSPLTFVTLARAQDTTEPAPPSTGTAAPEDFGLPPSPPPSPPPPPVVTVVPAAPTEPAAAQPSAPPAPPPAPAAPAEDEDDPKARKFRASTKVGLGYQFAQVHGVPVQAGRFRVGVGAQNAFMAHYGTLSMMVGETETERRVWDLRVGWSGDARVVSVLRLGIDLELGYLFVRRASIDERMWALGIGAGAHVGVDVLQWGERDDRALTIDGRIEAHIHFGNAVLWGPTIAVGIRF